jgi:hypothetical protein
MAEIDLMTDRAHSARIYDYILGGKTNYEADRAVADASMRHFPALATSAHANRGFMHRAAQWLVEQGVRQFLDIGTGIPTSPNLHEIVHASAPEANVVYVDNDPIVLAHARALLTGTGSTAYVDGDMRDPAAIMASPQVRETLDLGAPVAFMLIAVVHFIPDDDEAYRAVRSVVDLLPPGSYLALTSATDDFDPETGARVRAQYAASGVQLRTRTLAEAERFFDGLELVDPGVVQVHKWHNAETVVDPKAIGVYGGVARIP